MYCIISTHPSMLWSLSTYVHHDMSVLLTYRIALLEHEKEQTRQYEATGMKVLHTCK